MTDNCKNEKKIGFFNSNHYNRLLPIILLFYLILSNPVLAYDINTVTCNTPTGNTCTCIANPPSPFSCAVAACSSNCNTKYLIGSCSAACPSVTGAAQAYTNCSSTWSVTNDCSGNTCTIDAEFCAGKACYGSDTCTATCSAPTGACYYNCNSGYLNCDSASGNGCECGSAPSNHCSNVNGNAVGGAGTMPTDSGSADATHKYWHYSCGTACSSTNCAESCTQTDCSGTCVKCPTSGTTCSYQTSSEDFYNQCTTTSPPSADSCKSPNCNGAGACDYLSGEQSQAACMNCTGASYNPTNFPDNSQDAQGSNLCNQECKKCSSGSCANQASGEDLFSQCAGLDCHTGATKYYYGWTSRTCYFMLDISAALHVCGSSGACKTAADQCSSSSQGVSAGTCGICTTNTGCANGGTTGPTCPNQGDGSDTYGECGALSCTSPTAYYYTWVSSTCYYRANVGDNVCSSSGACRTQAQACPSQGQGSSTGVSCNVCQTQTGCSGTTAGTCPSKDPNQYTGCTGVTGCSSDGNGEQVCACTGGSCSDLCGNGACNSWETTSTCSYDCDRANPTWSSNSTNSTIAGTPINFSLYWTDNVGLSKAITSLYNGTAWVNASSWCSLSGTTSWCNQTLVVNVTPQQLWWKQYANDTSLYHNWNASQNFSLVTASSDATPPTYSNMGQNVTNTSTIALGDSVSLSAQWNDNVALSMWWFYNGTSNMSANSFTSGNWSNITWNSTGLTKGTTYTLIFYANDTANNQNGTGVWQYTIDNTPPTYSSNSSNSTTAGTPILHSLNWSDNIGLSGYIFSFDNCTGTLTNDTWTSFGVGTWSNATKIINSTSSCTIMWCVYANDTSNNWNGTSCSNPFTYTTQPAVFISISISPALMNGIMFGTINPNTNDNPALNNTNGPGSGTAYNITIDSSTTVNVDLYHDASGNLVSGSYIIGIGNVTNQANTTSNTGNNLVAAGSTALSTTYSIIGSVCQNLLANSNCWMSYWLDSPTSQPPGNYITNYKYCAVQNGAGYGQCG